MSRRGYIIPKSDHISYDDNVELKIIIILRMPIEKEAKKMLNEVHSWFHILIDHTLLSRCEGKLSVINSITKCTMLS